MSCWKNASSVICGSSDLSSETEYIDKLNEGATPSYIGALPYLMTEQEIRSVIAYSSYYRGHTYLCM